MHPIVINTQTKDLYQYEGDNKYRNLRTGKTGEISEELAKKYLVVSLQATEIINSYPLVGELISRLGMGVDKVVFSEK